MSLKQQAVKGVVWSVIQSWGTQAIALLVFFVLARLLGPKEFGMVALATVFTDFVRVFLDQGFSAAIVQRRDLEPQHLDTAFWTNLGIGLLMTGLGIFAADWVANSFREPQLAPIIKWLSLSFLLFALSGVQQAIFQRDLAFKPLAIRSLAATIAGGVVGVAMALLGYGVWSLVGKQLANGLAQVFFLWWASSWRPKFKVSRKHFNDLFSFGIKVTANKALYFFGSRSDDFLIGYYLGSVALGYYTIAYRLLLIMTDLLTTFMTKVAMPIFSKLQEDRERLKSAFYNVSQFTGLFSFPIFLGMAVLAHELVQNLFGSQWLPSVPVMQVLAFVGILQSIEFFNGVVITSIGKPSWNLLVNSINTVANVIAFILVVKWGIIAVAAAFVIRGYLLSPINIFMLKKLIGLKLSDYLSRYTVAITGSVIMAAVIFEARKFLNGFVATPIVLVTCILLGAVIYVLTIRLIAPKLFDQVFKTFTSALPGLKVKKHE
jgi:O-antigen/teichoic acid export membrane protein